MAMMPTRRVWTGTTSCWKAVFQLLAAKADDYFSLLPQDEYFFAVFSALWQELGGTLQGELRVGTAPADQVPFAKEYPRPPLSK